MQSLDPGRLEIVPTEDLGSLNAESLRAFDAIFFFTSGELALSGQQKTDLLEFVRAGKGFGGAHSATDTLYTWPEFGDLIGARFDGHPWVHQVRIDIEDPEHPATRHLGSSFEIVDEIYQFREFSRDRVRVLMTLNPQSVDLQAAGVSRSDEDFALAWVRRYGQGRVFYTALGHFDQVWQDPRFRTMLRESLLWLTGQTDAGAEPRPLPQPEIAAAGNSANLDPRDTIAPGSLISIYGSNLTTGSQMGAAYQTRLLGTTVRLDGRILPLLYASPAQINALVPEGAGGSRLTVHVGSAANQAEHAVRIAELTPGVFAVTASGGVLVVWATGLGPLRDGNTVIRPTATVGGAPAAIRYAGLAPGFPGLYQINIETPAGASGIVRVAFGDVSFTVQPGAPAVP